MARLRLAVGKAGGQLAPQPRPLPPGQRAGPGLLARQPAPCRGVGDGSIHLWKVATSEPAGRLAGHRRGVLSLAFTPDGATLASGGADGVLCLWDVTTSRQLAALDWGIGPVRSVAVAPDGMTGAAAARVRAANAGTIASSSGSASEAPNPRITVRRGIALFVMIMLQTSACGRVDW